MKRIRFLIPQAIAAAIIVIEIAAPLASEEPATSHAEVALPAGINDDFKSKELSVEEFVKRFEIESREVYGKRHEILELIGAKPGDRIIDLGAGTGFYTFLFSEAVGRDGEVLAVDIAPAFIRAIERKATEKNIRNVKVQLATDVDFTAESGKYDLVFVCDAYHHFEHPRSMNAAIAKSLREGGRLVVCDFKREEGKSRQWVLDHVRAGEDVVRAEIEESGLKLQSSNTDLLTENYILTFKKATSP
jgi:predicted methyltransferase